MFESHGTKRPHHAESSLAIRHLFQGSDQIGFDRLELAMDWLRDRDCRRVFAVADATAASASGAWSVVSQRLAAAELMSFDKFSVNPRWADVRRGLQVFHRPDPSAWDAVLAIGGGTAIDIAKLIRGLEQHAVRSSPTEFRFAKPSQPLLAVPTTAGTGSEATGFAVLYVDGVKHSLEDSFLMPDVAVVDYRLTRSLPASITAASGLDALCQAIESLWSIRSTAESSRFAREALHLAWANLEAAVLSPSDASRQAMAAAAHYSGRAIQISKTTAVHAFSYYLTAAYAIPHGFAVALLLGPILQQNAAAMENVADPRGAAHVREVVQSILAALGGGSIEDVVGRWVALLQRVGCPTRLDEVGISSAAEFDRWASSINLERLANHPIRMNAADVRAVFERAARGHL